MTPRVAPLPAASRLALLFQRVRNPGVTDVVVVKRWPPNVCPRPNLQNPWTWPHLEKGLGR